MCTKNEKMPNFKGNKMLESCVKYVEQGLQKFGKQQPIISLNKISIGHLQQTEEKDVHC